MAWPQRQGRTVPYLLQQRCFTRDNWTCTRCGYRSHKGSGELHADHIHNRATGGPDTLANLTTLCAPCHREKTRQEATQGTRRRHARLKLPPEPHPGIKRVGDGPRSTS